MLHPFHNLRSKTFVGVLLFLAAWLAFAGAAQTPVATGVDSIRVEELRQKLTYIASEQFKGRGNGTPELNEAAEYIAGVFQKNGLQPVHPNLPGEAAYYQTFDMYTSRLGQANELTIRGIGPGEQKLRPRVDFIPEHWSVSGNASGPVVFVGNPLPDSINLHGKIAFVMESRGPSEDPEFPENAAMAHSLEAAGASGVIVGLDPADSGSGRILILANTFRGDLPTRVTPMGTDGPEYPHIPVMAVSSEVAREWIPALKNRSAEIDAAITADVERITFKTQNVIGIVEGADPKLKSEVVIVGAHYDHDGEANGQIWYGADDDGSGTAALLELAEAFGNGSSRPARTILLCAWAGEEKGLLGSRYYTNHALFPLSRTVAMFQMDMVGRNEQHGADREQGIPEERAADNANALNVLGSAFSPDLRSIISRQNDQIGLLVHFRYDFKAEDLLRRSDQWSFLLKGIPAVFFFTGLHPDYHTPRDTPSKINYPKLEKITKLVYLSALKIANNPARPEYVDAASLPTPK